MLLILETLILRVFFLHIEVKGIICKIIVIEVINQRLRKNYSIINIHPLEI